MHVAVVGAGTTGLFLAVAMARRGHRVTVVDRDSGPAPDGTWDRKGVMQFHHPHGFRCQAVDALAAEVPEVVDALIAAGAGPIEIPERPGELMGLRCRRAVFEQVLRAAAVSEPRVSLRVGHCDGVLAGRDRVAGVRVDGARVEADLVLDASGRAGRLGAPYRAPSEVSDCGMSYVSQQHVLLPDAELGPMNGPIGHFAHGDGYLAIVFLHDNRTISTLIARASSNDRLRQLHRPDAFGAALAAIPSLAIWTDPERSRPLTGVLPGGRLINSFRGQLDGDGRVALPGLVFVGDTVCTTNPTGGRGVSTGLMQAGALLGMLDADSADLQEVSVGFDDWCAKQIRPWFDDHLANDDHQLRRWAGVDVDLTRPLCSNQIVEAAEVDPSMMRAVGPYLAMETLPAGLREVEQQARDVYATGWRLRLPDGPTGEELADLLRATQTSGASSG